MLYYPLTHLHTSLSSCWTGREQLVAHHGKARSELGEIGCRVRGFLSRSGQDVEVCVCVCVWGGGGGSVWVGDLGKFDPIFQEKER